MGKEEKKEKKRRRESDSSSSSDSEEERKHKKHKKDKHKKDKKEKKDKKDKKDKKSSRGGDGPPPGVASIGSDDYFNKNPEFRAWLSGRGKQFGDLADSETRKLFDKFVDKWNGGDLDSKMYQGLSFSDLDRGARTSHKWGFAKKLDSFKSDTLRDQILSDTKSATLLLKPGQAPKAPAPQAAAPSSSSGRDRESEEQRERRRAEEKLERKREAKHRKDDLEELVPKADPGSFQARMEKKAQKGHYCREREPSPEMRQSDLMGGGGGDDVKARLMKQEAWRNEKKEKKEAEGAAKLSAYQEKEKEKMNEFRKMMGLPLE